MKTILIIIITILLLVIFVLARRILRTDGTVEITQVGGTIRYSFKVGDLDEFEQKKRVVLRVEKSLGKH